MSGCIPALVPLLSRKDNPGLQSQALRAVAALSYTGNRPIVIQIVVGVNSGCGVARNGQAIEQEGGMLQLVAMLGSENASNQAVALGTLSNILAIGKSSLFCRGTVGPLLTWNFFLGFYRFVQEQVLG